jgi:hypothetical protein
LDGINLMHHIDTAATGVIGFATPVAAATLSLDSNLDLELRIASMVIGIFVGLVSFAKICYDLYADHKSRQKK